MTETIGEEEIAELREGAQATVEGPIRDYEHHLAELTLRALDALAAALAEQNRLLKASSLAEDEVCQTLGKALGYPWYKDDQANFPGATERDGVCVGEHVAGSIAAEAASKLAAAWADNARLRKGIEKMPQHVRYYFMHQIMEYEEVPDKLTPFCSGVEVTCFNLEDLLQAEVRALLEKEPGHV